MAKETKKPAKGTGKVKSASKASAKAAKPAEKAAAPAKKAASSAKPVAKKAVAKPAAKVAKPAAKPAGKAAPSASKVAAGKPASSKAVVAKSATAGKPAGSKPSGGSSRIASAASGIVAGVAAAGVVASIAASKAKNTEKGTAQQEHRSTMPTKKEENTKGAQGAANNAPEMKLSVNDAEILATATERYGAQDLEWFKNLIHEQRAEASEEFDIISEQMLDTSGEFDADNQAYSLHTAEQGTDAMEREKTFLHAQRTSDYIKKLDEAMARIERGTYGICVICGKLIEKQRLAAVPITQKHVDCKNKTQAKKLSVDQVYREFPDEPAVD